MDKVNNIYSGETVYFGTIHKKEEVLRPLLSQLNINCVGVTIDSDSLGTFSGEVKRVGTVNETLRKKIRLTMEKIPNGRLFLASEGSFGPHPAFPFFDCNQESLLFYDKLLELEIISSDVTTDTNINEITITPDTNVEEFLQKIKFPSHGVILQAENLIIKGITDPKMLAEKMSHLFLLSKENIKIVTDMRANFNPTRMNFIGSLGIKLLKRISSMCPSCHLPGYDIIKEVPGLPCRDCGCETNVSLFYIYQCNRCLFNEQMRRMDKRHADPSECDFCNP